MWSSLLFPNNGKVFWSSNRFLPIINAVKAFINVIAESGVDY
jgi:hypothetical protein